MNIQETTENYLETILMLRQERGYVRSVDIATKMGFSKPTISEQMKKYRELGYVEVDENGYIALTDVGDSIARQMYERHVVLTKFLVSLGVSPATAAEDSCKMEHDLSEESFACILRYYKGKLEQ